MGSTSVGKIFQSTLPARGATTPEERKRVQDAFQSTLPARGATYVTRDELNTLTFQSTLPARGATEPASGRVRQGHYFNPRSPHGERPARKAASAKAVETFQSTLPARGATARFRAAIDRNRISIHAPRTGSDVFADCNIRRVTHFNPRSPHGERPCLHFRRRVSDLFQSTLPARGATDTARGITYDSTDFNPRSPHGERLCSAHP